MTAPIWLANLIKKAFPYRRHIARLSRYPVFAKLLDLTIFRGDDVIYLPKDRVVINQEITQPGSTILPSAIVDHFIEKASYRWVMNECICRVGDNCQDYPHDIGCIFLGEAVLQINPKLGRLVSKEEALAYAKTARERGLVQMIGRDRIDNLWMGVGPFGKLLTICSCCPCCCLFRVLPDLDARNRAKITRMPGVSVSVDPALCSGCGKCARDVCFVEAIQMVDRKTQISDACVGCGRCVEACPRHAISLTIQDSNFLQKQITRISQLADITSIGKRSKVQIKQPVKE